MRLGICFFLGAICAFSQITNVPGGSGGSIASTTSTLKGNGSGAAVAVSGTGSNCVHVDGTSASCSGVAGASAALDNLSSVSINTSLLPQTGVDVGSSTTPFRNLFLWGNGTFGTTSLELTGTPTAARVWTIPDLTDTIVGLAATQTLTNKTLTTPTIASFVNATHNHTNAAGGGTLTLAGAAFANQGITTTVYHGNASGNGSFAVVTPSDAAGNTSGSGNFCLTTSCAMTTPNIGTPSAGTLTNATGLPISTGISGLGSGIATWMATPTSANLLAAMTTKTGTGSVVFGTAPTLSGVTLSDITGSTQCLHVSTLGLVTGTGSDCGGGGGSGTVNSGTSGHIGYYATSSTAISSDSNLDDGATTANTLTYAGVGGISSPAFISTGSTAGLVQLGQGTANTTGTNTIGIQAPTSVATSYVLTYPGANPSGGQAISFGTPSSGVSTGSWITPMTTSTSVQASQMPALTGDATSSAGAVATTVNKVNGIAYSATAAAHSVEVVTTANTTATAKVLPDCVDTGGNHLNYTQSTDAFSCGTSGGGGGSATTFWQSDSDNVAGSGTSTNSTTIWSVYIKTPVTFGTIATLLSAAIASDNCDLGIYNSSGTLQAHWGATAITAGVVFQSHTISGGGTVTLNPAWYEVAFTCTSTSQMFVGSANYFTQFSGGSNPTSGNSTSGGALNASIGVPATSRTNLYRVPSIALF